MAAQESFAARESARPHEMLGALARDARIRSRMQRLALQILIAAISAYWIGPWAFLWVAALQIAERSLEPLVMRRWITPVRKSNPVLADRLWLGLRVFNAALSAMGWIPAWAVGGDSAGFFAATMMVGAVIHSLIYFSNSRKLFYASITPPIVACVLTPLIFHAHMNAPLLTIPIITVVLLRAHWAQKDQIALFESVNRNRTLREEAEEVSRAKTRFLRVITHELRTPLNAVIGYAEMLRDDLEAEGKAALAADAGGIGRAGWRLLSLMDDVIDFSDIEAGQLEVARHEVDVRALIEELIDEYRPIAAANKNGIEARLADNVGVIVTDQRRLRQCLGNLLSNACKFTKSGRIGIECDFAETEGRRLLRVTVSDTGCGISQAQAATLFNAFTQIDSSTTRAKDGLGVGLAITQRLARLLGGDVTLKSTPGVGSAFTLSVSADPVATLQRPEAKAA